MRLLGSLLAIIILVCLSVNVGAVLVATGVALLVISLEHKTIAFTKYASFGLIGIGVVVSVAYYFWLKNNADNLWSRPITAPTTFDGQYRRTDGKVTLMVSGDTVVFNFPKGVAMNGLSTMEKQDASDGLTATAHIKGTYSNHKPYKHRFTMRLWQDKLTLTSLDEEHTSFTFARISQ